jgi:hypothetical protein
LAWSKNIYGSSHSEWKTQFWGADLETGLTSFQNRSSQFSQLLQIEEWMDCTIVFLSSIRSRNICRSPNFESGWVNYDFWSVFALDPQKPPGQYWKPPKLVFLVRARVELSNTMETCSMSWETCRFHFRHMFPYGIRPPLSLYYRIKVNWQNQSTTSFLPFQRQCCCSSLDALNKDGALGLLANLG